MAFLNSFSSINRKNVTKICYKGTHFSSGKEEDSRISWLLSLDAWAGDPSMTGRPGLWQLLNACTVLSTGSSLMSQRGNDMDSYFKISKLRQELVVELEMVLLSEN